MKNMKRLMAAALCCAVCVSSAFPALAAEEAGTPENPGIYSDGTGALPEMPDDFPEFYGEAPDDFPEFYGEEGAYSGESDPSEADEVGNIKSSVMNGDIYSGFSLGSDDISQTLGSIKDSVLGGGLFSVGDYLSAGTLDMSFTQSYDLSSMGIGSIDTSMLGLQFESMTNAMSQSFVTTDLSGQSAGCMQLFQEAYGDIADSLSISSAEIPESFNVSSMLDSAKSSINSAYSEATSSGTFAQVKNSISIGSIFSAAESGAESYELAIDQSTKNLYDKYTNQNKSRALNSYNKGVESNAETAANYSTTREVTKTFSDYYDARNSVFDVSFDDDYNGFSVSVDTDQLAEDAKTNQSAAKSANNTIGNKIKSAIPGSTVEEADSNLESADGGSGMDLTEINGIWYYTEAVDDALDYMEENDSKQRYFREKKLNEREEEVLSQMNENPYNEWYDSIYPTEDEIEYAETHVKDYGDNMETVYIGN